MKKIISFGDSGTIEFEFEEPADRSAFFVFGLHKCGSTLLQSVAQNICLHYANIPVVKIPASCFSQGITDIEWRRKEELNSLIFDGYAYLDFRYLPEFLISNPVFNLSNKFLMVRDPRDAVVSMYYSAAYSHVKPKAGAGKAAMEKFSEYVSSVDINDWAVTYATSWLQIWDTYDRHLFEDATCKVVRYEDIFFDKERLVEEFISHLDIDLPTSVVKMVAERFHVVPKKEDPTQHIRKGVPGDHKEKLTPDTVARLNERFEPYLERFEYSIG